MVLLMKKKTNIATNISRTASPDVMQDARLLPTSDQKPILYPLHSMPKTLLPHKFGPKEYPPCIYGI